jgi:hypothetical protein
MWLTLLIFGGVVLGDEWVIHLKKDVDPNAFAQQHGLVYVKPFLDDLHVFSSSSNSRARTDRVLRADTEQVVWAEHQDIRPKPFTRMIPDPLYESQWHLHTHPFGVDADHAK